MVYTVQTLLSLWFPPYSAFISSQPGHLAGLAFLPLESTVHVHHKDVPGSFDRVLARLPDMINQRDAQIKPTLLLALLPIGDDLYKIGLGLADSIPGSMFAEWPMKFHAEKKLNFELAQDVTAVLYSITTTLKAPPGRKIGNIGWKRKLKIYLELRVTVFAWLLAALTVRQGTNNKWNNELVKTTWKRCVKTIWKCRAAVEVKEICALAAIECAAP
ncbi:hypothetical protein BT96DRAFT_982539 [Gymnopus androsaceus JB14]|uniref:Uncharacterized protein n=1 Tax=Gymnopus androsaceus JB14 TaxID=1447944 RepID=A0A6A4GDL9_9AGAR|nr:hypothetical protein BT96DRAFT_982539 [Gymnopus androsaceus JB14]